MSIEEPNKKEPKKKTRWHAPVKLIAISAVSILLGCGLCSAGGFNLEGSNTVTTNFGMAFFWFGALAFLVGVLWWLVAIIASSGPQGKSQ